MDTKSNIPTRKKIVSVDILDIDKYGYGPNGAYTRREWRNACLNHFESGFDVFMHWQKKCIDMDNKKEEISFDYELIFDDGTRELKFNNEYSPCSLDFIGQVFERLTAENYNFLTNALFDCITVRGFSNFHQCQFRECATFKGASFLQNAYFGETTFYSYLHLSDAIFYGTASFTSSKFSADALFDSVEFNGPAGFENTLFSKNAWFNSVVFNDYAWFIGASFENVAEFYNATFIFDGKFEDVVFKSDVTFLKATFNSQGLFKNVNFFGDANFMAATFQILGLFEEARFHLSAPNFRGCQIDCTRLEFSGQNYFPVYESNSIAVKNYSFLKRLSDEHGQTDQALNFNALELRVKAKQSKEGFWFKIFTRAYEIISDFGRSFAKPLKYYLGLLLVVYILALGNAVVNSPKDCKAENLRMLSDLWRDDTPCDISKTNPDDKTRLNGYRAAAEYTVYRAAGILDFSDNGKGTDAVARRLFGQSYEPGWMRFVGLVKAIASTALLFLAALGLRNKYRIK